MTATVERVPAPAGTLSKPARKRAHTGRPLGAASGTTLGVIVIWLSLLVLLPLAAVVGKAFGSGWDDFWSAITSSVTADALKLTIGLSLAVALVNGAMGTLVAWCWCGTGRAARRSSRWSSTFRSPCRRSSPAW